ncbi:MAG: ribose-phosphate pyrophosphokinase-like domain-containing protein, partial [Longicatena sp.]
MEKKTVVFALTSSVELANEIVAELGIPLGQCDVKHFSDGEIMVELGESVRGKNVYIIQSTCAPVSSNIMEVLIAIDACKRASAGHISVVMPYFGYARQDRKAKA